jgi:hypothetical protein
MVGSYPASILNIDGSTLRCPFVPEIMHRRAPELFFHQLSWKITIKRQRKKVISH